METFFNIESSKELLAEDNESTVKSQSQQIGKCSLLDIIYNQST